MPGLEQRLVEVGVELLESTGPDQLGLREIARRAGVSHGAPRRYFPTHKQLLAAIARVGLTDLTADLETAFGSDDPVLAGAHAYVGFARRRPEMFRLIFRHDLLADSGYSLRELSMPLLRRFVGLISSGHPGLDDARERAVLIWTHVHGIATVAAGSALQPIGLDTRVDALVVRAVRAQLP